LAVWQLQEAKQKLSEVVDRSLTEGAQTITRHGVATAVVLSIDEFRELQRKQPRPLRQILLESVGRDIGEPDFADMLPKREARASRPPLDFDEP
jgi:prevent-host-death family protein